MRRTFYQPRDGVAADFIPFYENGTFYLFYLKDYRDPMGHGEGTPWFLITTTDFVHFTEHGEVLPRGAEEEQDLYVFTGSVTKIDGRYHIYYTGHNPHLRAQGRPEQAVMHAVSDDLFHWTKCPDDTIFAPEDQYEIHDWRDPFLYFDEESGRYLMLLAARSKTGVPRRRGITALCSSPDGTNWQVEAPFWAPELYFTHECPDLFKIGDWYYLIFSEFSQDKVTRYRMSRSPHGPWMAPADDRFDSVAYYAAKSCGDEQARYLFGWLATREGESDEGNWQWGGCLAVHELVQNPDGTLSTRLPRQIEAADRDPRTAQTVVLQGEDKLAYRQLGTLSSRQILNVSIKIGSPTGQASIALCADELLNDGYILRIELNRTRIVLDRWPRPSERSYEVGLERPIRINPDGLYHVKIVLDGTAACAYLNDEISLCFRMYGARGTHWGILSENAVSSFDISD